MDFPTTTTLDKAEGMLARSGLPAPERPGSDAPALPPDISEIPSKELGRLMGVFAGWVAYARYQVARAEVVRVSKKAHYEAARARQYLVLRQDERMTEREREAATETNQEIQAIKRDLVQAEALVELMNALLKGYEQGYFALSRELTRRGVPVERGYA